MSWLKISFCSKNRLKTLLLNNNKISRISNLGDSLRSLENLSLMNNRISDLKEIDNLYTCKNLIRLVLYNNIITQVGLKIRFIFQKRFFDLWERGLFRLIMLVYSFNIKAPDYRLYVISRIPNLKVLDFQRVTHKER